MSTILIVDDREDNRRAYKLVLEDARVGWKVLTACNESESQKIIKEETVDLIITDLVMLAEQGGLEVLRIAKEKDPFVMVIILTAFEESLDRYKAFEMGAFDCLSKGIPGVKIGQELVVKSKTALNFRQLALQQQQTESQKKIDFLRRYFDPNVFEIIKKDPSVLSIKQRTITICFWDIRGFSLLCEILKASPSLVSGFLGEYCEMGARIIFKYGGVLDKFIGDGIMGIFGVLNHKEDDGKSDAVAAVNSAIEMRSEFTNIVKRWMKKWKLYTPQKIEIGLGCGIHTGEALVGNVGTDFRDQFTALGPHVNFASRIEGRATEGQILISQSTEARIKSEIEVTPAGEISDIKNIPGRFNLFTIKS